MLDRIWSGWRAEYVADAPSRQHSNNVAGSVFSQLLSSGATDEETHIIYRGKFVFVILNIYPYTSGHALVLPYREVADLGDLMPNEMTELWATVTATVDAARFAYVPDGVNVGLNLGSAAGGSARRTSTCMLCRAGPATRTSCRRSPTPRPFLRPLRYRLLVFEQHSSDICQLMRRLKQ
jgi:ATP adenylyltransferase